MEYIFGEYRGLMLSKAHSILKDRALAEDALCDSFSIIGENIGKIDDPRSSRAIVYVVTIVRNCSYALLESDAHEYRSEKDAGEYNAAGLEDALYDMSAANILRAVGKLGGENKNIFLLSYSYGYSNRKIAKTLNETEGCVAARLQRAQRKLRAILLRGDY